MAYQIREYQQRAVDAVYADWNRNIRKTLLVMATGTGKTVVAGDIAARLPANGKLLFLVHREELMFQSRDKIESMTGHRVALEGGDYKADKHAKFVVAMVQSLTRRLNRFDPDRFTHGAIDEAHHAVCKTYMSVIDYFNIEYWFGLTATPKRADGEAMGKVFDGQAFTMFAAEAIDQGWLTPIKSRVVTCNDMNLGQIKLNAGEFNQKELKAELLKQSTVSRIAQQSVAIADGRQTVIFCQNIEQSQAVCRTLKQMGEQALHVDGKIPKFARRSRMQDFAHGRAQFLVNCSVIEEGVDVPGIEVVANARPTKSQTRIVQAVGRGLRPLEPPKGQTPDERCREIRESRKPHCTVIDFIGNLGEQTMKVSGDLLGGDYDDDVRRIAIEIAKGIEGFVDWVEVYKQAEQQAAEQAAARSAEENERRKSAAVSGAESRWARTFNPHPYAVFSMSLQAAKSVKPEDAYGGALSSAIRFLEDQKVDRRDYLRLTNVQQLYFARVLHKHVHKGFCTWKQANWLYKFGYDPRGMSKRDATLILDKVAANGWARPAADGPNTVFLNDTGQKSAVVFEQQLNF